MRVSFKILLVLVFLIILFFFFSGFDFMEFGVTPKQSPCPPLGDVDNDGQITQNDTLEIQKLSVSDFKSLDTKLNETEFQERADVNDDGIVTVADSQNVQQYLEGKISNFDGCSFENTNNLQP